MGNTARYSITENPLCFVCHDKPDKCQENFNCGCYRPDNSFLCKNKCASQKSEICQNTYSKAIPILLHITSRCVSFSQQAWRGSDTPATNWAYVSNMVTDILDWKIQWVGGFSTVVSLKPTNISANFNNQWSLSIRNQIIQNIPAVMKYRINVTRFQEKMSPSSHLFSSLTNEILVPNCSKAQDQQSFHC